MLKNQHMKIINTIKAFAAFSILAACTPEHNYIQLEGYAQGTTFHITLNSPDGNAYQKEIDSILAAVDNSVSVYNPYSTVSNINNNTNMRTDSILSDLFRISMDIYEQTDGYFDISAAPLFDFWGFGSSKDTLFMKMDEFERGSEVERLKAFTGMDKFRIENGTMVKPAPEAELNFNAIAQGYTCDLIARFLDSEGITDYLIEVGGEIYCNGKNSRGEEWSIGIDRPVDGNMEAGTDIQEIIKVTGKGIVSSGNYRKFIIEDGKKFSHTIDPKSGYPAKNSLLSATVIAENATIADAYATYFMVIGLENARNILSQRDDLEGYLVYADNESPNGMSVYYSRGLKILTMAKNSGTETGNNASQGKDTAR